MLLIIQAFGIIIMFKGVMTLFEWFDKKIEKMDKEPNKKLERGKRK